jgi:hypothetical protein
MSTPAPAAALDAASAAALERTRSAVLNVLVAVGTSIAASGFLLRWHDRWAVLRGPDRLGRGLIVALVGVVVASYLTRRVVADRSALRDPSRRLRRFHRGHVLSAIVAACAVPLGLAYGWFIKPRLDAVVPFWVAALALGFLALPRAAELEGLDPPAIASGSEPDLEPGPGEIPS